MTELQDWFFIHFTLFFKCKKVDEFTAENLQNIIRRKNQPNRLQSVKFEITIGKEIK